jgi:hypothetical protein
VPAVDGDPLLLGFVSFDCKPPRGAFCDPAEIMVPSPAYSRRSSICITKYAIDGVPEARATDIVTG